MSSVLVDERDIELESNLERGVALFKELVRRANAGEAIGVSYVKFVERVHGVRFGELRGRKWSQSDVSDALQLADQVTEEAGRRSVRRGDVTRRGPHPDHGNGLAGEPRLGPSVTLAPDTGGYTRGTVASTG